MFIYIIKQSLPFFTPIDDNLLAIASFVASSKTFLKIKKIQNLRQQTFGQTKSQ
jgi:hypothetical protein